MAAGVTEYGYTTENASNAITAVAKDTEAVITIAFGEKADYSSGDTLTWETGANLVTITVSMEGIATKYTLTVTKE